MDFVVHNAMTYVLHGGRQPKEIPPLLGLIERQYEVTFPTITGIYTEEFWLDIQSQYNLLESA